MNVTRSFPLLDISIRSGGDGRTVEAYAAVWDTPTKIHDQEGRYLEQIARTAFDETITVRGDKPWPVLFNHGLTVHGTPSDLDSMPIGASIEAPRVDSRGLVTVSRYHNSDRAEQALEAIRSGAVTAQSFSGRFGESSPKRPTGGYHPNRAGDLVLVTRSKVDMDEYGPAVFAAYPSAAIMGVRSLTIPDQQVQLLRALLPALTAGDEVLDPLAQALLSKDEAVERATAIIAEILAANPHDEFDDMELVAEGSLDDDLTSYLSAPLTSLAARLDAAIKRAKASGTPSGVVADGSGPARPGRLSRSFAARKALRDLTSLPSKEQ